VLLLAAGAALLLLSSSMTWAVAATAVAGAAVPLDGAVCLPAARAIGVLALAGVGGLLAARGRARSLVGAVLGVAAALGLVGLVTAMADGLAGVAARTLPTSLDVSPATVVERSTLPLLLAALGLLCVFAGGAVAAVTASRWPALGQRFERGEGSSGVPEEPPGIGSSGWPKEPPEEPPGMGSSEDQGADPAGLWAALDRGEDPTRP